MEPCAGSSKEKEVDIGGMFKCYLCQLDEQYDYFGTQPPFAKHIKYHEKCYVKKDPFSPLNKGQVLALGGNCILCNSQVCMNCSLFYSKRLCAVCCDKVKDGLPKVLETRIKKLSQNVCNKP